MVNLIELKHERFIVDLLYRTSNNLLRRPIYQDLDIDKCFAHPLMHERLMLLPEKLEKLDLKLVIFDCYRPVEVQREFWKILPDPRYIAPPDEGSNHNRGTAVDCYLAKSDGTPLLFPTVPDGYIVGMEENMETWLQYLEKAHHTYVGTPEEQELCENRETLKALMESVGLVSCTEEWWHYEIPNADRYEVIEYYNGK